MNSIEWKIHRLKIWPTYFSDQKSGEKTFEVRKDDRGFCVGDFICLQEWDPTTTTYTGMFLILKITYKIDSCHSDGLKEGFCILGTKHY